MTNLPFPYIPSLPSLNLRTYAGPEDIPAMLAVHDACRDHDRIDSHSVCYRLPNLSCERYAAEIQIPQATVLAIYNEETIAHGFMEIWGVDERCYLWQVFVKPAWRNQGIGTALHHWGEAMARQIQGNDPRAGLHLANTTEYETDAVKLLHNEGYHLSFISPELAFDAFDTVSLPLVPGIAILPLSPADTRAVARALCAANLDESMGNGSALEDRIDQSEDEWIQRVVSSDPALSFVAFSGSEVVGAYLCNRRGDVGEIAQVAVRPQWRGQGIARALAQYSLKALQNAGCVTARLFTSIGPDETESPTGPYVMYRKFGFYPIAKHLRFRKTMVTDLVTTTLYSQVEW